MTGVFFELSDKGITCVATDAHRLVRFTRLDVSCPKTDTFIVPKKPLNLLKTALPSNEDELAGFIQQQSFICKTWRHRISLPAD